MRNLKIFSIISIAISLLLSEIVVHAQISPPKKSEQFLGARQEFSNSMNSGMNENLQDKILEVIPEYWFYGSVALQGGEATKEFIFKNIGTESFNVIVPSTIGGGFFPSNPGDTLLVDPNTSQNMRFTFDPFSPPGFKFKTVIVENGSDNAPYKKVYLGGIGSNMILEVTPYSWYYGIVPAGNNSENTFTLKNVTQNNTIKVTKISIESDTTDFSITNPAIPISPFDLKPKDSLKVTVRFHPTAPDTQIDFFKVNFRKGTGQDAEKDSFMVFLKGMGGKTGKILKVVPESFNFDSVTVGKDSVKEFLLINEGTQDINVNSLNVGTGEFSLVEMPGISFTLTQGDTDSVSVSFSPVSMGLKLDTLKIWNDSDNASPFKKIGLQGVGVSKILSVEPDSAFDFGKVIVGNYSDMTFKLRNDGNLDLSVTELSITVTEGEQDEFFFRNKPSTSFTLRPGDTKDVTIRFMPGDPGFKKGIFKIANNSDNASPIKEIILLGNSGGKILAVEPDTVFNFGSVSIRADSNQVFMLKNAGNQSFDVTGLSIAITQGEQGEFSLIDPPTTSFPLDSGATKEVKVRFKPITHGSKEAIFKIENNSDNAKPVKEIKLKGTGIARLLIVAPDSLDFGVVPVDNDSDMVVELSNGGNQQLSVTGLSVEITSGELGEFLLVSPPNTPFLLDSGATRPVTVRFSPVTKGSKKGILKIQNNSDNASPIKDVYLTGNSLDAVILSFINYPNPFGNETTIEYALSKPSKVSINIYDVSGDLQVELKRNEQKEWESQGKDQINWDGTDFRGRRLANGVYICELIVVANGKEERRYRKIAIFEK